MKRRAFLKTAAPLAALPFAPGVAQASRGGAPTAPQAGAFPPAGADGWISLMNGRDLDGFYTFLQSSGRGVAEARGMVTVENEMIHILGNPVTSEPAENGYISTVREFENYRARVEYRWGVRRFPNRLQLKRNSGLQYHAVGPDSIQQTCVELQMEQGNVGDAFMVGGARALQSLGGGGGAGAAANTNANANPTAPEPTGGRKIRDTGDFELLDGWNQIEVVCRNDTAMHLVNGVRLNNLTRLQQPDARNPGQFIPLTRGRIAVQLEAAELWIRRFEIRALA